MVELATWVMSLPPAHSVTEALAALTSCNGAVNSLLRPQRTLVPVVKCRTDTASAPRSAQVASSIGIGPILDRQHNQLSLSTKVALGFVTGGDVAVPGRDNFGVIAVAAKIPTLPTCVFIPVHSTTETATSDASTQTASLPPTAPHRVAPAVPVVVAEIVTGTPLSLAAPQLATGFIATRPVRQHSQFPGVSAWVGIPCVRVTSKEALPASSTTISMSFAAVGPGAFLHSTTDTKVCVVSLHVAVNSPTGPHFTIVPVFAAATLTELPAEPHTASGGGVEPDLQHSQFVAEGAAHSTIETNDSVVSTHFAVLSPGGPHCDDPKAPVVAVDTTIVVPMGAAVLHVALGSVRVAGSLAPVHSMRGSPAAMQGGMQEACGAPSPVQTVSAILMIPERQHNQFVAAVSDAVCTRVGATCAGERLPPFDADQHHLFPRVPRLQGESLLAMYSVPESERGSSVMDFTAVELVLAMSSCVPCDKSIWSEQSCGTTLTHTDVDLCK